LGPWQIQTSPSIPKTVLIVDSQACHPARAVMPAGVLEVKEAPPLVLT
jgi:hypothetical protein